MRSLRVLFWLLAVGFVPSTSLLLAETTRPDEILSERYGLKRLSTSNVWVLPIEEELRLLWQELPQYRDHVLAFEQVLTERIDRNSREWNEANRVETSLLATLANLSGTDAQRTQVERRLKLLRQGITAPERLGDLADVRGQLVQLNDQRHSLWLAAQAIRHKTSMLHDAYAPLQQDTTVVALLHKAGNKHRLGPARNYRSDLKKLADLERPALTDWGPLFLSGDRQRITLLANDTTPVTFTWTSSPEPAFITAAMAEAIGLQPSASGKDITVSDGKRTWKGRPAVIPYLRLGKYELREVEVAILPPEAESAGARIGLVAFKGYRVEPQPSRLRIVLTPVTDVTP